MQKFVFAAVVTLCASSALAATVSLSPVYSSFNRTAAVADFDPPSSSLTVPSGIDAKGAVYGYFISGKSVRRGFIRSPNGTIATFREPHAGTGSQHGTTVSAVNAAGDMTGFYEIDSDNGEHGFMRVGNTFTEFDPPGSINPTPTGISSNDTVIGIFRDAETGETRSFVRKPNGRITVFDDPDVVTGFGNGTTAIGINTAGTIAGDFDGKRGVLHGFVRDAKGNFTTFDPPKSAATEVNAINTAGAITGTFFTSQTSASHGFIRAADGTFQTFDVPGGGAGENQGTVVQAINDAGDVTGYIVDANNIFHAFIRKANGHVSKFEAPHAAASSPGMGTFALAINASDVTTGNFTGGNGAEHGFVRTP